MVDFLKSKMNDSKTAFKRVLIKVSVLGTEGKKKSVSREDDAYFIEKDLLLNVLIGLSIGNER